MEKAQNVKLAYYYYQDNNYYFCLYKNLREWLVLPNVIRREESKGFVTRSIPHPLLSSLHKYYTSRVSRFWKCFLGNIDVYCYFELWYKN